MPERLPRQWIGEPVHYRGRAFIVLEVLDADSDWPQLVLRSTETEIQADQWGDAHRRVPGTVTVELYSEAGEINPELEWEEAP